MNLFWRAMAVFSCITCFVAITPASTHAATPAATSGKKPDTSKVTPDTESAPSVTPDTPAEPVDVKDGVKAGDADEDIETLDTAEVETETPEDVWYSESYPRPERALNLMSARTLRRNSFLMVVTHRTHAALSNNAFHNFLGFDGGQLKIGLGLRYGILDTLDVGMLRLNGTVENFDAYEFDARWQFLQAKKHYLDMAIRAGVTWFSQDHAKDAVGYYGQLLMSRLLFKRLLLGLNLAFHSNSSNDRKKTSDHDYSLAALGFAEVRITDLFGVDVEVGQTMAGYHSKWPTMTLGLKMFTNRHTFAVVVSNTQYTNADGIVANTWRGFKDLVLGFNITREL